MPAESLNKSVERTGTSRLCRRTDRIIARGFSVVSWLCIVCIVCPALGSTAFAGGDSTHYRARAFFKARLEPERTVLHGAGQDFVGFEDYCHALGPSRMPVIYMTYVGIAGGRQSIISWGKRLQEELAAITSGKVMPQIGLNMTAGKDNGAGRDAAVAEGLKDDNVEALCQALKALDRPAFVRIGYEFEGGWNGYKPESYKAAFIRVTQAFRKHHLECATVWCSAGGSAGNLSLDTLMKYYPGDGWVDWWGIDIFSPEEILSKQTMRFCDAAAEHRKPVMIGESTPRGVGVLQGQASWDKWFAPYFTLIQGRPEIKAFCYINWEWKFWSDKTGYQWDDWGDGRIERNEVVLEHYRQEMDRPLYEQLAVNPSPAQKGAAADAANPRR